MTEDEARNKWCPMVRYVPNRPFSFGRIVAAVNRWIDDEDTQLSPDPCQCIASDCACWEWDIGIYHATRDKFLEPGESYSSTDRTLELPRKDRGHCGLINR